MQAVGDASCVELLLTACTDDDPELTAAPVASCEEPRSDNLSTYKRLTLAKNLDGFCSSSRMRRLRSAPLADDPSLMSTHVINFRGCKGALHAKTALVRSIPKPCFTD